MSKPTHLFRIYTLKESLARSRSTWAKFYRSVPELSVHKARIQYNLLNSLKYKPTKADRFMALSAVIKCRYSGY